MILDKTNFFVHGVLRHLPLLEIVLGRSVGSAEAGELPDHDEFSVAGHRFAMTFAKAGHSAPGLVLSGLTANEQARLEYFETGFGNYPRDVAVQTARGELPVRAFFPSSDAFRPNGRWALQDWVATDVEMAVFAVQEFIEGFGQVAPEVAAGRYEQMLVRAASRLAAGAQSKPRNLRFGPDRSQVRTRSARRPYSNFFTVEEHDLQFPRFEGQLSAPVTRAALVGGDAVTVLPYDPVRDRVMVIEQFRFGPQVRGDLWPWKLEPIAGRIDAGETPEQAVHREMAEETGLSAGTLLHVADYYPSPGAWTEYLMTYVALADLPDEAAGIGGLEGEGEDIKSHILPFEKAMELITTGEAETGPLILTLLWLQARREAIRQDA